MLKGSCACGRVRYEIRGEFIGPVGHCHCWQCRKHSGASFGTTAPLKTEDFAVVQGQDLLKAWESSPGIHRFFASCCGSPIYKRLDSLPQAIGFRLGTLDTDPGRQVEQHIFVSSKVPWIELDDGLPRHPGGSPYPEKA